MARLWAIWQHGLSRAHRVCCIEIIYLLVLRRGYLRMWRIRESLLLQVLRRFLWSSSSADSWLLLLPTVASCFWACPMVRLFSSCLNQSSYLARLAATSRILLLAVHSRIHRFLQILGSCHWVKVIAIHIDLSYNFFVCRDLAQFMLPSCHRICNSVSGCTAFRRLLARHHQIFQSVLWLLTINLNLIWVYELLAV